MKISPVEEQRQRSIKEHKLRKQEEERGKQKERKRSEWKNVLKVKSFGWSSILVQHGFAFAFAFASNTLMTLEQLLKYQDGDKK